MDPYVPDQRVLYAFTVSPNTKNENETKKRKIRGGEEETFGKSQEPYHIA